MAVVVAVILLSSGGGGSHAQEELHERADEQNGSHGRGAGQLRSPNPSSKTVGEVAILAEKGKRAFFIEAKNLPSTGNFFYAIWLYNSPTSAEALSSAPAVGSSHKLAGGAALPANAAEYHEILLTRESSARPTSPGHVVLRGASASRAESRQQLARVHDPAGVQLAA